MKCSAAMPWPMQGSVEAVMAQEGKVTVGKYLAFTQRACEEDLNNRAAATTTENAGRVPAGPHRRGTSGEGSSGDTEEIFYDSFTTFGSAERAFEQGGQAGSGGAPRSNQGKVKSLASVNRISSTHSKLVSSKLLMVLYPSAIIIIAIICRSELSIDARSLRGHWKG